MKRLEKMASKLNREFRPEMDKAMERQFGIKTLTEYNLFDMALTTSRLDGSPFTRKQRDFMNAFSDGYAKAMDMVKRESEK